MSGKQHLRKSRERIEGSQEIDHIPVNSKPFIPCGENFVHFNLEQLFLGDNWQGFFFNINVFTLKIFKFPCSNRVTPENIQGSYIWMNQQLYERQRLKKGFCEIRKCTEWFKMMFIWSQK